MLTRSCKRIPSSGRYPSRFQVGGIGHGSLNVVGLPVLYTRDLVAFPFVDAVVQPRAEVIVFVPLDRAAAQAFGVDLEIFHGRPHFGGVGRPARALERCLDRHAADPAFGHGLRRIFRAGLFRRVFDFLLYR